MFNKPIEGSALEQLTETLSKMKIQLLEGQVENALRTGYTQLDAFLDVAPLINMLSAWNQAEHDRLQQLITQDVFQVNRSKVTELLRRFLTEIEAALPQTEATNPDEAIAPEGDPTPPSFPDKKHILVLYDEGDLAIWNTLKKHFFLLQKMPGIHWSDGLQDRPSGLSDDFAYLQKWIDTADKVILLITPNTLAYPVYPLAEHAATASKLIPLKLVEVDLGGTLLETLGSLPSDNRFVSEWPNENAAHVDIAQQLRNFLQKLSHG